MDITSDMQFIVWHETSVMEPLLKQLPLIGADRPNSISLIIIPGMFIIYHASVLPRPDKHPVPLYVDVNLFCIKKKKFYWKTSLINLNRSNIVTHATQGFRQAVFGGYRTLLSKKSTLLEC